MTYFSNTIKNNKILKTTRRPFIELIGLKYHNNQIFNLNYVAACHARFSAFLGDVSKGVAKGGPGLPVTPPL